MKDRARYLRQSIQLAGEGSEVFLDTLRKIGEVYAEFNRCVPAGKLHPLTFIDLKNGNPYLDISNRYFTSARDDPHGERQPFSEGVDPEGYLEALGTDQLYHGTDNIVHYLERAGSKGEDKPK